MTPVRLELAALHIDKLNDIAPLELLDIIGITHVFHALTFDRVGSQGSCLNTRPSGRVSKHRPRDPASVNAMKQTWCQI